MSHDTRRKVVFALVALIVVAMVLSLVGCTTTSGDGSDPGAALTADTYPAAMEEICVSTTAELDALPEPPEGISLIDWAGEVSRVLDNEATRFDGLRIGDQLRAAHGSLVRTSREQAEQFALLGGAIDESGVDSSGIGSINDEIRSLSLGREELAVELGVPVCGTRALA